MLIETNNICVNKKINKITSRSKFVDDVYKQ